MMRSATARIVIAVVAVFVILGVLRYKPWQHAGGAQEASGTAPAAGGAGGGRQQLTVGFLPVT
jgi:hypothetical protein